MAHHVRVIAEIGENHMGNMEKAKMLIEAAADSGADYVKFQSYTPEAFRADDKEYEWFKRVALTDEDHYMLKKYAQRCGVTFLSSPFNVERAKFLCEKLNLQEIKIASGVMLKFSILDYVNTHADRVFLSTGMATLEEIKQSLEHLQKVPDIYILHCVTQYPCRDEDANIRAISHLKKVFNRHKIGYSDHTIGTMACLAAVALGAEAIEKHFTFDKNAPEGSDHIVSATPAELKEMVEGIRRIEALLGEAKKGPTLSEREIINFVRNRFVE